jgi:hypothetical protein
MDAAQAQAPNSSGSPRRAPRLLRHALKVLAFAAFVLFGSVAARGRPANGFYYRNAGEIASSLIVGLLVALVLLAIVGSVSHLARGRSRGRRWRASVTTFPVMLITLLLLLGSAAGQTSAHQQAVQKATPNPSGTQTQREKANLDAQAWAKTRTPLLRAYRKALLLNPRFLALLKTQGNTASARQLAAQAEQRFATDETRWQKLPTSPLSDLVPLDAEMLSALGLAARAFADYGAGLRANVASGLPFSNDKGALALIDKGDSELNRSTALVTRFAKQLIVLNKRYSLP